MIRPNYVVLLKEGTDKSQGKPQLISNINACMAVADILKTTLGPRGMDKLIHTGKGKDTTITNDGATILHLLDIVHPAAKVLVDIAQAQDDEVGDGTTSVCLLAAEFLKAAKPFVEEGIHPQIIMRGFRKASRWALEKIKDIQRDVHEVKDIDSKEGKELLIKCAGTALNSKIIAQSKEYFAPIVVDAVLSLDRNTMDLDMIGTKKITGGSVTDSFLVKGVAFEKTFSYAGFEQQPKHLKHPRILLLNVELELKRERASAEITIDNPKDFQSIVDAEWKLFTDKLDKIFKSNANVILSKLPIGDLATQYFADRNVFCAGRVPDEDLDRVAVATGGMIQTSLNDLSQDILGTCGLFEEKQVGKERFNFFTECVKSKTVTLMLRGGAEQYIEETARSLHDAIMIVKRTIEHSAVVGGGGAIEMEISRHLRQLARNIPDKTQQIIMGYARAFEVIPKQLSINAGMDPIDILTKLRSKHHEGHRWEGVDIQNKGTMNAMNAFVWEPALVKRNAIAAGTEAACVILSIDETGAFSFYSSS